MTENRPFAVWLRSIAGLVVLAGLLGLGGCGGGSGAPNNPFRASGLTVSLGSPDLYSGVAATLTVTGGFPPYLVTSSKPNVLAIAQSGTAGVFTLTPAGVATDTPVVITVQDGAGTVIPINVTVHQSAATLQVVPLTANAYSGFPATLSVSGGTPPYTAVSSNQLALSIPQGVVGNTVTVVPAAVGADTEVVVTLRDAVGATATSTVTVKAAVLVNSMTLKDDNFALTDCPNDRVGSANPTDDKGSSWICSGQTGTVGVQALSPVGGGLSGRQIRFDVVQGEFQIFTNGPGQPETFALSYTVPTDQNGNAVVRIRANPDAHTQTAIVQATDLLTGNFVRGTYVINQVTTISGTELQVIPSDITFTGFFNDECAASGTGTYYIFGGRAPYTIQNTSPGFIDISPTTVTQSGGGFDVSIVGGCVDPAVIAINDSQGHATSVTFHNKFGTQSRPATTTVTNIPITVTPSPIPLLTCGANTNIIALGGGTSSTSGGVTTITPASTLNIGVSNPSILTANPTNPAPGVPVTITRQNSGTIAGGQVTLTISDGRQFTTVTVPVTVTCP